MLRNFTPHVVSPYTSEGIIEIPSSGVARVEEGERETMEVEGLPCRVAFPSSRKDVVGLPPAEAGVWVIVSSMVLEAASHRKDLLAPATGPADDCVRNEKGQVVGVTRLHCSRGAREHARLSSRIGEIEREIRSLPLDGAKIGSEVQERTSVDRYDDEGREVQGRNVFFFVLSWLPGGERKSTPGGGWESREWQASEEECKIVESRLYARRRGDLYD